MNHNEQPRIPNIQEPGENDGLQGFPTRQGLISAIDSARKDGRIRRVYPVPSDPFDAIIVQRINKTLKEREARRRDLESCRPLAYALLILTIITVCIALYLLEPEPADTTGLPPMVGKGVEL